MRLTFVNTSPIWGGGEVWTMQTALAFIRRQNQVSVVVRQDSILHKRLQEAKIHTLAVSSNLFRIVALQKSFSSQSSGLFITNSGQDLRWVKLFQLFRKKIPVIYRRGLDQPVRNNFIKRFFFREVQAILVNSKSTRNTVEKSLPWFEREKINTIYNYIEVDQFLNFTKLDKKKNLNINSNTTCIGIVGRLSKQKGHSFLFLAFKKVLQKFPDTILLVVGDGELNQFLKKEVQDLDLSDNVLFVGHVDEVQSYYDICHIIAIPSSFEGFCFTAVEAQLMNKPVVATNVSSLPEVCLNGKTAFLVPYGNSEAFSDRLQDLIGDPELRIKMGAAGFAFVKEHFSSEIILNKLENLFIRVHKSDQVRG